MKIFITGGSGYIGSHLSRALVEDGHNVLVIDQNPNADLVLDLSSEEAVEKLTSVFEGSARDSVVIHLAAKKSVGESVAHPELYVKNNVGGTKNLLRAMKISGANKLFFASTAAVYGDMQPCVDENSPTKPISPYAETKLVEEKLIQAAHLDWGLRHMTARFFNVSGSGWPDLVERTGENIFPKILSSSNNGVTFKIYGDNYPTPDGTCIRDYVHVMDLVDAHRKAMELILDEQIGIINLGTEVGSSVNEVVSEFKKHIPLEVAVADRREGDMAVLLTKTLTATSILGWEAKRSLANMVESVI